MIDLNKFEFWFITGSQSLYGDDTLKEVAKNSKEIVAALNNDPLFPCKIIWRETVLSPEGISRTLLEANADSRCAGVIAWMHTFSPAKMWIPGLKIYAKPLLQFNTQYNATIPYDDIDMDFMNLNQSAHGDREFGHISARMEFPRKVIAGHWKDNNTRKRIAQWMRAASAAADAKELRIGRFGDNMRDVAVTDGDKVEAMIQIGWSVPYYGIGDLVAYMEKVPKKDIDILFEEYNSLYTIQWGPDKELARQSIREQAKIEIAMRAFFQDENINAFTTNFQDLYGMKQLPGLACQRLMADGFGFAGEGDWKTAGMVRALKVMSAGLDSSAGDGTSFMEDYTYNFESGNDLILGAHMLEICPSIAFERPSLEVHQLGIGGKNDPARLVFDAKPGPALCAAVVDMGSRFRCVVSKVQVVKPKKAFPKLPVARVLWKPEPDLTTAAEAWILAGGGHHTAFSNIVSMEMLDDWAEITGIELIAIDSETTVRDFRNMLRWNAAAWRK